MARPRLGDSETKRLQLVITENEIEAIEEWQHERRIASRSEAIRILCKIGMRLDEWVGNLDEVIVAMFREAHPEFKKYDKLVESNAPLEQQIEVLEAVSEELMHRLTVLAFDSTRLSVTLDTLLKGEDAGASIQEADAKYEELTKKMKAMLDERQK